MGLQQKIRNLKMGDILFRTGDAGESMFVILKGEIEIYVMVNDDKKVIATLGKGEIVGEMALVDQSPRSASAVAKTNCELTELSRMFFNSKMNEIPSWMKSFYQILVQRLRDTNQRLDTVLLEERSRQIVFLLSTKLKITKANKLGFISLPWENTVEDISFLLKIPKKHVEKILLKLIISPLAKGEKDEADLRVITFQNPNKFEAFALFCKEQYYKDIDGKVGVNIWKEKNMVILLECIINVLKEQTDGNDIDQRYFDTMCQKQTTQSIEMFSSELEILMKKGFLQKKISIDNTISYEVNRKQIIQLNILTNEFTLFAKIDENMIL